MAAEHEHLLWLGLGIYLAATWFGGGLCIGAASVLLCTIAGGMWAVTLTDMIQVIVLVCGTVIIAPVLLADMGGWGAIAAQIPSERFYLFPRGGAGAWFDYARDWLVIGLGNLAGQDLIQRSLSARDEGVAYKSAYYAGLLYVTVGFPPVLLGMAGAVVLPDLADPDMVMMELALKDLPVAALVLFAGALMSAILSSADSALLAPHLPGDLVGVSLATGRTHPPRRLRNAAGEEIRLTKRAGL